MENDKMKIKLLIANTYYPMTIKRDEEGYYREAARRINDKLNQYRVYFPNLDMEKYMTMISLDISVMCVRLEEKNDVQAFKDKIEELSYTLDNYLKEE